LNHCTFSFSEVGPTKEGEVTAKTVTKSSVSESLTDSESLRGMDEHKYIK